jgi:pimeloyl-ACP methyl ester carboxylesterase
MSCFVLIPGAGGSAWYWHRLVPALEARGHEAVAVELPAGDPAAGFGEYADAVVAAAAGRSDIVLVAQSLAGFTAPLVCERIPVSLLVYLNAMAPRVGEQPGDWWTVTGFGEAREAQAREGGWDVADLDLAFVHDVPPEVLATSPDPDGPNQTDTPFQRPWPLDRLPDVPTRFLQGRDDRFFPLEFQRKLVRERLDIELDEMPGGHLVALSQPEELADRLVAYLR